MTQLAERTRHRPTPQKPPPRPQPSVQRSLRSISPLSLRSPPIQAKLTVNQPGDKYEQEADAVASAVMHTPAPLPQPDDNRESIQRWPLQNGAIQRKCAACGQEDPVQRQIQQPQSGPNVQFKPLGQTITPLHRQGPPLQRKCAACESEDPVQRQAEGAVQPSAATAQRLQQPASQGQPLTSDVRAFMEPRFGVDLSPIRVHTGRDAIQMTQELGAQAFTHGRDIYFGAGKSPGKNALTAHELTHTIQQGKAGRSLSMAGIQRRAGQSPPQEVAEPSTLSRQLPPGISRLRDPASSADHIQRLGLPDLPDLPELPSLDEVTQVGEDLLATGSELASDAIDTVAGVGREVWNLATTLASALGGMVTLSGSRLVISVPPLPVCPSLPVQFTLPEIGGDFPFLAGVLSVTPVVSLYGALGFHAGITPELSGQIGPCTLNGFRIVIDPLAASLSASGSITVMTAVGLGGELRLGLNGEVGVLIIWPDPPLLIQVPVVALEAGIAGFGRGILASSMTLDVGVTTSIGSFSLRANRQDDLGLGIDLGLAGYGALSLLGQNLCTLYWPFWQWHRDATLSTSLGVSLDINTRGASAAIALTPPALNVVPFDALPLDLQREMFSDDCPLCDAFYALGLMPSQQKGGAWTGHPTPRLSGPLDIYPRVPGTTGPPIASGSTCRGACGPNCDTCDDIGDLVVCEDDGSGQHQFWIYKNVAVCPTHDGCRQHDAGYDWCAAGGELSLWGPCHRLPDFEAVCNYGVANAVSWIFGGPPHDPEPMLFAERSASPAGCTGPCPDDSEAPSGPRTYQLCLPDIPLFEEQSVSDHFHTSTGNIPLYAQPIEVPYLGFVMLNIFARGSLNATVGAGLGPAWLGNVCLTVDPVSGVYEGMAELHVQAGLEGGLTLTGTVGATADWLCLVEVIRIEGGLEGTGRGNLETELVNTVTIGCVNGQLLLDSTVMLEPCLNLSFDLDAMLMVQLFKRFTLFRERWNLLHKEWGDCWQLELGGFSIPLTSHENGGASNAANAGNTAGVAASEAPPLELSAAAIDASSLLNWLFSAANSPSSAAASAASTNDKTLEELAAAASQKNPCGGGDQPDRDKGECNRQGKNVTLNLSEHHPPTARNDCGNAGDIGKFAVTGNAPDPDRGAIIQKVRFEYDYQDLNGKQLKASGDQEGYYESWSVLEIRSNLNVLPQPYDQFNYSPQGSNDQNQGLGSSGWWKITGQAIYAPCFDPSLPEDQNGWVQGKYSGDEILGRAGVLYARRDQPEQWNSSVESVERVLTAEWDCSDEDSIQPTNLDGSGIVSSQANYSFG